MPPTFDIGALIDAKLDQHHQRLIDDVRKVVEMAIEMHNTDRYMTRAELAPYIGYDGDNPVGAMNTAWSRARKAGKPDPVEACATEIGGVKRWRKATVDAVLAMRDGR